MDMKTKMNGNRSRLLRFGTWLFTCSAVICVLNSLLLPFGHAIYHYSRFLVWLAFAGMLGITTAVFRMIDRIDETHAVHLSRRMGVIYVCGMGILYLLMGYWLEYTPSGDNFMLYQASQTLARDGKFEAGSDFLLYFGRYSNQWGFLLLLTGIYRLLFAAGIRNTFYPLVLIQTVLYLMAFCSLYRIAFRLGGWKGKLRLVFLLISCLPMTLAATVLYTDTFSLPFVVFTVEAVLRVLDAEELKTRLKWSLLSGFLAFLGGQIKMTVLIVMIAAGIVWLLHFPVKQALVCTAAAAGVVMIGIFAVQQYMLDKVLDRKIYMQEHTPVIHWIMMSIPSADNPYGGYNSADYAITWGMMDEGADHEEVMNSIYSRMKDKIYTLRYPNRLALAMLRKNSAYVSDGTFGMTEMLDDRPVRWNIISEIVLEPGRFYRVYGAVVTGIWMAQLSATVIGACRARKSRQSGQIMLHIACFGILLFLMIWEARSRYLFGYVPLFLLLAALSMHQKDDIIKRID